MSVKEFRDKSSADLLEQLVTLRREQFNLRMQQATGQRHARTRWPVCDATSRG